MNDAQTWRLIAILCLGVLMVVVDSTIVNVALQVIGDELRLTETGVVWVVNAYMLTFASTLLVGGRLGDLYGKRVLFLIGIAIFVIASLACGSAPSGATLIAARAVQGLGGAIVTSVALAAIVELCPRTERRTRAIALYGFVCALGGACGLLIGGILTSALGWRWIFLINLPIGVMVFVAAFRRLPAATKRVMDGRLELWGAVSITVSLILLVFRSRRFSVANLVRALWATGACAWFFVTARYMQEVLGYEPYHVALAFLPANLITAAFALSSSAAMVMRWGVERVLATGLMIGALGLALLARMPTHADFFFDLLPGMMLFSLGSAVAAAPMTLAAMKDTVSSDSGLASGIFNIVSLMGSALGLAIEMKVAVARSEELLATGVTPITALAGGYHAALFIGALSVAAAAALALFLARESGRACQKICV